MLARLGSSPLARGTLDRSNDHIAALGLIPARAGNTRALFGDVRPLRAHPRSRGEHAVLAGHCVFLPGSSPLARGTLPQRVEGLNAQGLIPARAGNT